ncbi:3-hydroxybenzoate 6-hydroxylase, partial [Bacillus sp. V3B]|nr:3-hydroxybenzoate 6-hydroxylase [Bacillus sp. V3B]
GEVGAGIQLAANATNVLQRLGVMEKINEIAVFPKRLVLMDAFSGEELSALDLGDVYKEKYGAPYIVLHRSDLHHILVEACEENPYIELVTNQSIVKTVESEGIVTVTAANGDQHSGKAVIGADGIWSNVRKLFSEDEAVCSQYV